MALKLENEFVVAAPIGPTWQTLLDLERVAGCLPGATIQPVDAEGTYKGSMRVKLGPVSMNYTGTARVETLDEESHTAVTRQGKVFTGVLVEESGSSLTLVGPTGQRQVILRANLEELSSTGKSAMPDGLEKDLKHQDVADVIAFLRGQKH